MPIDINILRAVIKYNDDGTLEWLEAPKWVFPEEEKFSQFYLHKRWNSQNSGQPAITYTDKNGYRMGMIFKTRVKAHQVVWALHNGSWPETGIDHINGNPSDNRIENLRCVSQAENMMNIRMRKDNKSGCVGVYFLPDGRFTAQITKGGKTRHIGVFDTLEEAKSARLKAQSELGFSARHGT
jgi:hypothetical protein